MFNQCICTWITSWRSKHFVFLSQELLRTDRTWRTSFLIWRMPLNVCVVFRSYHTWHIKPDVYGSTSPHRLTRSNGQLWTLLLTSPLSIVKIIQNTYLDTCVSRNAHVLVRDQTRSWISLILGCNEACVLFLWSSAGTHNGSF